MAATGIRLHDVTVAYHGDITILNGVHLHAKAGEVTGIIGPNGAGKSTVLKTLFGFLRPRAGGRIELGERDITTMKPDQRAAQGVAFVPQSRSLFGELSVEDNLQLGCWPFRGDKARMAKAMEAVYERFPILREKRRAPASSMSGGQQRFLELGRALLLDPQVILLDEPTAMIAPKLSKEIYRFIRTLADEGRTVVLVDQNVRQCINVSDEVYILELGRNKAQARASAFHDATALRGMIASWMDYKID
ncbi:MAG: ABC transporter ATP-binding protein [Ottowia sp.]|uniref:ABC transporter ATP-binding protein n=1 Tax=Ottowia sp. TaxID=1898956 RepID=UPI0039E6427C